mmetsp:Transcript_48767/g.161576  ORF Transcript_48767/g.161576 Transcript_48767/m.161576 type:complete len:200 (+) Transcript_48767:1854-2453(+)
MFWIRVQRILKLFQSPLVSVQHGHDAVLMLLQLEQAAVEAGLESVDGLVEQRELPLLLLRVDSHALRDLVVGVRLEQIVSHRPARLLNGRYVLRRRVARSGAASIELGPRRGARCVSSRTLLELGERLALLRSRTANLGDGCAGGLGGAGGSGRGRTRRSELSPRDSVRVDGCMHLGDGSLLLWRQPRNAKSVHLPSRA